MRWLTEEWKQAHKKLSTWLAAIAAAGAGGLGAYALFPERVQGLMPDWFLIVLAGCAMIGTAGVPIATSIGQAGLKKPQA